MVVLSGCVVLAGNLAGAGLVDFSPGLLAWVEQRFGERSISRLMGWQKLVRQLNVSGRPGEAGIPANSATESEVLDKVNRFFNRISYQEDQDTWHVPDYWATPVEVLGINAADCEDYAIAKYLTLKEIGVPVERLRITYVKAIHYGVAHMVLAYYPTPDADPLILDNIMNDIRKASLRTDLQPVFSFNDDDLWTPAGRRPNAGASQVRLWRGLLDKLERERRL
jgi:predicted transglutaminase-like cysteine proteinase